MELKEALSKLDEQASVADFLRDQKILGVQCEPTSCIISNYLYEATSVRYVVTDCYISKESGEIGPDDIVLSDEIPNTVRELIKEFDAGLLPDLVANGSIAAAMVAKPAPQDGR